MIDPDADRGARLAAPFQQLDELPVRRIAIIAGVDPHLVHHIRN